MWVMIRERDVKACTVPHHLFFFFLRFDTHPEDEEGHMCIFIWKILHLPIFPF
jgi:hypothetical protein